MTRPVIANQIGTEFGELLRALPQQPQVIDAVDPDRPWEIPPEAEILVTRAFGAWKRAPQEAPALPALKWVQTYSAGAEVYPDWLKQGRILTCGQGLTAPQIAEFVMAAILNHAKDLTSVRLRGDTPWQKTELGTLQGKTLGLIGFGAIARDIIARAAPFGMRIIASRRSGTASDIPGVEITRDPLDVAAVADHLVLAAPLTNDTRHLVNSAFLARMREGAHLINISRGGLVDQDALIAALDSGRPGFATLDVTEPEPLPEQHPLRMHERVLLTPHISYTGGPEQARFFAKVSSNLQAYLGGTQMADIYDPARGY